MAAAQRKPDRVVVVDLDSSSARSPPPEPSAAQTLATSSATSRLREAELLRTYGQARQRTACPPSPIGPSSPRRSRPTHVDKILTILLDTYDQVVIDNRGVARQRTMRAFEHAENVLFVINPEIAALKALAALIEYLNEAGTVAARRCSC